MTANQFLAWLEHKLQEQGLAKVVPDGEALAKGIYFARVPHEYINCCRQQLQ